MRFTLRPGLLPLFVSALMMGSLTPKALPSELRGVLIAQAQLPCQPPNAGEYLLMVVNTTPETPVQLQRSLPATVTAVTCDYLGRSVTRVSGFTRSEVANAWAQYLNDLGGLQAFVARPANATTSVTSLPAPSSVQTLPPDPNGELVRPAPYTPQPLGAGYAVLVNYFDRPEVAIDLQQLLSSAVGLVSYEQQPYLLAAYTTDPNAATRLFRTLSDRNFTVLIVDSSKAVLLTPTIARP